MGATIGAGIYALIGEVAGRAGMLAPLSFLVAASLAAFTGLSFAELSSRFPRSAGEAVYVREGFGSKGLGLLVGLLVVLAGTVSAATIATAFAGYLAELVDLSRSLAIALLVIGMGLLSAWGVRTSVAAASLVTVIEIAGLLIIIWVARESLGGLPDRWEELRPPLELRPWRNVLAASLLAFYAFLGFEDMVNVAEEVRDVRRVLPLAIILTLSLTLLLYAWVSLVAVLSVPPGELARSAAPMALLYERATGAPPVLISVISVLAMLNGALVQLIMAPRILYGLATQGALPEFLGRVHPRTRTPLPSTLIVTGAVLALAISFPLAGLAEATSVIALAVFTLVNLSLWAVKRRDPHPEAARRFPRWVPVAGALISAGFLVFELSQRLGA